jgi:hypothetical protein
VVQYQQRIDFLIVASAKTSRTRHQVMSAETKFCHVHRNSPEIWFLERPHSAAFHLPGGRTDLPAATAEALRHVFANGISQDRATPDFPCIATHFLY